MWRSLKATLKNKYGEALSCLQYGRDIVVRFAKAYVDKTNSHEISILDIGLGRAVDMMNIKEALSDRENLLFHMYGVESYKPNIEYAKKQGIQVYNLNIEYDALPFPDRSIDIVIMNQILEHTKEWYFIFKEVNRVLKPGGICIVGLPNLASWHERIRLLCGKHPHCLDMRGAHIRGVVMKNFIEFVEQKGLFKSSKIYGSYFYGVLNVTMNKLLAKCFPTLCVSNFVYLTKEKEGDFTQILDEIFLETNFYRGNT